MLYFCSGVLTVFRIYIGLTFAFACALPRKVFTMRKKPIPLTKNNQHERSGEEGEQDGST
jgi:hypothetical protein